MDTLQIRVTREQLETLLGALESGAGLEGPPPSKQDCEQMWSWLTHRYTRAWGLPPRPAAVLRQVNGS